MNRLIYFSATQNTYNITKCLSDLLKVNNFSVANINEYVKFDKNDFTVFICPIYNGNIVASMKKFINSLDGAQSKAIMICTYGSVNAGKALQNAIFLLQKQEFDTFGGVNIPMPHSYNGEYLNVGYFPNEDTIKKLADFILQSNKDNFTYSVVRFFRLRKTLSAYLSQRIIGNLTCKIVKNNDKCLKCKRCIKVCPVSAISNSILVDQKKCIKCGACVKECFAQALSLKFLTKIPIAYIKHYARKKHAVSYYIMDKKRLSNIIF